MSPAQQAQHCFSFKSLPSSPPFLCQLQLCSALRFLPLCLSFKLQYPETTSHLGSPVLPALSWTNKCIVLGLFWLAR